MTQSTHDADYLPVFEHVKRRDWGLGILAWEKQNTRGYLFENGQLRVMAEEFYSFMREVDRPHDEVLALYSCLNRELEAARLEEGTEVRPPKRLVPSMSLDDQICVFRAEYPEGFLDPQWSRPETAARLGAGELEQQIGKQRYRFIVDDALAVLRGCDLVPPAELKDLAITQPEHQRTLATAIHELLHGASGYAPRFERWLSVFEQTFRRSASWQIATALPALVHPKDHVSIRPASFREQAKWMAPRLVLPNAPAASSYLRLQSMAKTILNRLTDVGEHPRDLLDVHAFIRVTTRPAAKKALLGLKRSSQDRAQKREDTPAQANASKR